MQNYKIGQELEPCQIQVDKYRSYFYAGASGDFNPIHLDNDFAKQVGLGGIILHGLCTMAFAYKAIMKNNDPDKIKKIKVRFRQIVRPQDTLTIKSTISTINNNLTTIDLTVENQQSEQVITNGSMVIAE